MRRLGTAWAVVSGWLIAAHFFRSDLRLLAALALAFPWLLLVGRPWITRIAQLFLALAAAEWIHTLWIIAAKRCAAGQPWMRMAIILGVVALFTVGSAIAVGVKQKPLK